MSSTQAGTETETFEPGTVAMKLEVVLVPVSDVDRSKRFYQSLGWQLTVFDIDVARAELVERGVDVSEIFHDAGGVFHHAGTEARVPGADPARSDYGSFASFGDPDGNGWMLQEIKTRLPGR